MRHKILAILLLFCAMASAQSVSPEDGFYQVKYSWEYKEMEWSFTVGVPEDVYDFYRDRTHRNDDLMHYVLSEYDRDYIREIVKSFRTGGQEWGFSDLDNVFNVISFVQSLQYVTDETSRGEDDYVRYPLETLVDGVGDCEDVVILATTLLHEMGYSVLIVEFPEHLAMAIRYDGDYRGTYYEYEGGRYYYLEMTNPGWKLGEVPQQYLTEKAKLIPLVDRPMVRLGRCGYRYDSYYSFAKKVVFEISCDVENEGPGAARDLSIQVVIKPDKDSRMAYANETFKFEDLPEAGEMNYQMKIAVPRPAQGVVVLRLKGENFDTDIFVLEGVDLK